MGKRKKFDIFKRADRLRRRGTQWESFVATALRRHKINFLQQYVFRPYIVDFYLYDRNVVLEIDGAHHNHKMSADLARTELLTELYGVSAVIRWRNTQTTDGSLPALIEGLRSYPKTDTAPDLTYGYSTQRRSE